MARQDSRHRNPKKGRDAEYTYSSEIGMIKMDKPGYQRKYPVENYKLEDALTVVRKAIQVHPQSLP